MMALAQKFNYLSLERRGSVFILTLNRESGNKLNAQFCEEIIRAFRSIRQDLSTASGAVVTKGNNDKFWCMGVEVDGTELGPSANAFLLLLQTILEFPYPTVALITGHTFGGGCLFALAHDYRIMNSQRGFFCMPPIDLGIHFPGVGALPRLKLEPRIARKLLLEAHKWTGEEALQDGVVDALAGPGLEEMVEEGVRWAERWCGKARKGVYGVLRGELYGEAGTALRGDGVVRRRNGNVVKGKL